MHDRYISITAITRARTSLENRTGYLACSPSRLRVVASHPGARVATIELPNRPVATNVPIPLPYLLVAASWFGNMTLGTLCSSTMSFVSVSYAERADKIDCLVLLLVLKIFSPTAASPGGASANEAICDLYLPLS